MKTKKRGSGGICSHPNILELAQHLRQEFLFAQSEKSQIQKLNGKILRTSEKLFHLNWILRQQRIIVDQASLTTVGANDTTADVSTFCFTSAALDSTSFIDSYKRLGSKDALYSALLTSLRNNPRLVAMCLASEVATILSKQQSNQGDIYAIIVSSLYGDGLVPEDRVLLMHLLKELIAIQVATSEQPRRLLRHGSCAFSRVLRMFQESLSSAKLFLISALRDAVIAVLAEDDLYLDTDAERAVIRFHPEERIRHFGKEGSPEYQEKISKYKNFATDKLQSLVARFVDGIQSSVFCFPEHLRWIIRELYATLTSGNCLTEAEVSSICTDLVFGHFVCHAVMNPELYGIVDMNVSSIARFNLMQIAQVLQVLAMAKFEKPDSRFADVCRYFEGRQHSDPSSNGILYLSNIIDILIESGSNESLSPQDNISRCLKDVTRTCVLIGEGHLYTLVNLFFDVSQHPSIDDETKSSLAALLTGIPRPKSDVKNEPTIDKKGKVKGHSQGGSMENLGASEILVLPIGSDSDTVLPGLLSEEKVLELEVQKRQVKVRMNLESNMDGETESVVSGSEKRTRFSQDQESIGTSDNLEAISEGASTHSVESSLDTEDENDDVDVNEGDNLSDMVSANVSSGRGTPNVSGRDTPSSESSDNQPPPGPDGGGEGVVAIQVDNAPDEPPMERVGAHQPQRSLKPGGLPVANRRPNDIEEKFGKFDCKPSSTTGLSAATDETKSLLSDTWSTDVLASDTEGVDIQPHHLLSATASGGPHIIGLHHNLSVEISETASQSDAWSTDVLMSDTERLQEFVDMDDSSATGEIAPPEVPEPPPTPVSAKSDVVDGPPPPPLVHLRHSTPRHSSSAESSGDVSSTEAVAGNLSMIQTLGRISFDLRHKNLTNDESELEELMLSLSQSVVDPSKNEQRASITELLSMDINQGSPDNSNRRQDLSKSDDFSLIDFEKEIAEADGCQKSLPGNNEHNLIDFHSEGSTIVEGTSRDEADDSDNKHLNVNGSNRLASRASTGAIPKHNSRSKGKATDRSVSLDTDVQSNRRGSSGGSRGGFFKLPNIKNKFQEKMKSFKDKRTSMTSILPLPSSSRNSLNGSVTSTDKTISHSPMDETSDDILEKYRNPKPNPICDGINSEAAGGLKIPESEANVLLGDASPAITSSSDSVFGTIGSTKRKLRRVLSAVDIHGLPITCIQSISTGSTSCPTDAHSELVMFLRLLLSEAKHLNNSSQVVALQEAIRCVQSLDEKSCQQLFWSLREDYQRRSPYMSYLIQSRQALLSTEAHLDSLHDHLMQEKVTCLHNLTTLCVKQFLEKKEKAIAHFIRYFRKSIVADEKVQLVDKFLEFLYKSMDSDAVWQMASEDMVDHGKEVIERVVMSQIYVLALFPNGDGDVLRDQILHQHISRLGRSVTLTHKDLKIPKMYHSEAPWPAAQEEIWTINAFKTPKEKVQCVVRTCSIIMSLLSLAADRSVPAADDFMPVLVFVVLKANPPSLLSTVQYVNSFYEGHFEGEEAYWWTQFSSVVEFIKTMDYQ